MVSQNIILQTTTDWTLQRKYIREFDSMLLVKCLHISSAEKRAKLQYEFSLFEKEQNPWILKPIALEYVDKQFAILFEDFNGISLKSLMESNLSIHHFLKIAVELANACIDLQQKSILFQNLNPQHILVNPISFQLKLLSSESSFKYDLDLVIATDNPHEQKEYLPYFSPEQTGRLNREIDHRSDLYAMGVIFYELLSGQQPFQAKDSVDLVYEIITKKPNSLTTMNAELSPVVAKVIEKLLEKDPEKRYQSAFGLKEDLLKIQQGFENGEPLEDFMLGLHDVNLNMGLTTKLFGRESQLSELQHTYWQIENGDKKIVLIAGSSGYGKTAFVHELKHEIVTSKGYFVESKYEQLQQETTFAPMIQPLRNLLKLVYAEGEKSVSLWRNLFSEVKLVYKNQLMSLIPELKWFIDESSIGQSDEQENTKELNAYIFSSIQKVLLTFSLEKRPVVWFVDDLHWADNSSIEMFKQIYEQHRSGYFLLLATYRPEKITDFNEFMNWQNHFPNYKTITLQSLSEDEVRMWLEESLNAKAQTISLLAKQLHIITEGNPLFVKEAFLAFQRDRIIYFDQQEKRWQLHLEKINQNFLNNELLLFIENRMEFLAEDTRSVLQIMACIGTYFEFSTLKKLFSINSKELLQKIEILVEQGFIVALDAHFKWASIFELEGILSAYSLKFKFVHDRIQQVAYYSLTNEERAQIHYSIGNIFTENKQDIEESQQLNEAVKHFNYCKHLLSDQEKRNLAMWNFTLGLNAKKAGLFENALFFLTTSAELLPENHWQDLREQSVEIYAHLGECEYLMGNYEISEMHLKEALNYSSTVLELLTIYNLKAVLYVESDNEIIGVEAGFEALRVGKMNIPEEPTKLQVAKEFLLLKIALQNKSTHKLLNLPPIKNKEIDLLIQMIINITGNTYNLNANLTGMLLIRGMRLLLKYGSSSSSGMVFINYALLLDVGFGDTKNASKFAKLAITIADNHSNMFIQGHIYFVYGVLINHWTNSYDKNIHYITKAQHNFQDIGRHYLVSASSCFICAIQLVRGDSIRDISTEIRRQQQEFSANEKPLSADFLQEMKLWLDVLSHSNTAINWDYPISIKDMPAIPIMHHAIRLQMSFYLRNEKQGFVYIQALKQPVKDSYTLLLSPSYYFYRALWQFHSIHERTCSHEEKRMYHREIKQSIGKFKKWSKFAPQNYEHLYVLLQAENCRMKRLEGEAVLFYDRAIQLAKMHHFVQDEAIACERAANYYVSHQNQEMAQAYIIRGIQNMRQWGAETVAQLWETVYEVDLTLRVQSQNELPLSFDMLTVFKTTQSLAKEIRMEDLLRKMLFALLKHAGADIGYFIRNVKDDLLVVARAEASAANFTMFEDQSINLLNESIQAVVRYVLQSEEFIIIQNAQNHNKLKRFPPTAKSILCLPIHHKGEIIALLLLENTVMTDAFSSTQVDLLKMISGQIAVSIENAQIYEDLEKRVKERTKELDEMNKHLKNANDRLEKNELERKNLMHSISHELRSPITSTLGYIELILEGIVTDEKQREKYLVRSKERLLSLNLLIGDLFDLANLEAGRAEYTFTKVKVAEFYALFEHQYENEINNAGLNYSANLYGDREAYVLIDVQRIKQVITNLIVNAIKYTKSGGIQFSMFVEEESLICSIEDSGIGIPEKDIAFIFDNYYRASNSSNVNSNGIGLSICKKIIAHHHGEIFVESIEHKGSRFSFVLPVTARIIEGEIVN
ncbi:ATP-binding protein [Lysinibacillus sp. NPDC096418]|uniref:ATP-binding protein n=1 Tax=Lysinibacillus sp. NPDC096418 TaxID=3364138 RepID=UPI0037FD96C6